MATSLEEGKLWIETLPGEGWVPPGYSYPRHTIYKAFCLDMAQGRMNGAPSDTRTLYMHICIFYAIISK